MTSPDPHHYFAELFPAQWARTLRAQEQAVQEARRVLEDMRGVDATLRVEVAGEGGGAWNLNIAGGVMSSGDQPSHPPFLTLRLEDTDFAHLVREAGDSPLAFLGALAGQGGDLKLTASRLTNLEQLTGTLRFVLLGEGGFSLIAHFGREQIPAEPTTTLQIEREAYEALRSGELAAQDAFLSGQIQLEGDMQLAMQLALAVLGTE